MKRFLYTTLILFSLLIFFYIIGIMNPSDSTKSSTETVRFINGTYAVITKLNGCDYNKIGGYEKTKTYVESVNKTLKEWWDITNLNKGMKTINQLTSDKGMHNEAFLEEVKNYGIDKMSQTDFHQNLAKITDPKQVIHLKLLYNAYNDFGENALMAWDLGRANFLLGDFYIIGYLDQNTTLAKSLEITKRIQKTFKSWEEFNKSYMYGYQYWSNEDPSDLNPSSMYQKRKKIIEDLKADPNSPFQINWNTVLKKDWK